MKGKQYDMYDVLIIGGGPAGITAGIYAKRFNLKVGIFENDSPGGAVTKTDLINNYPGFDGIAGYELASKMFNQLMNLEVEYIPEKVTNIEKYDNHFIVKGENEYESKTVIIATGTKENTLNIPTEEKYFYRGISWCAVCDGPLYKDKDVAVVGGGMSAISSALSLSKYANKVYLIHRRDSFRGELKDLEILKSKENVEIITNSQIIEFKGTEKLESIVISNNNKQAKEIQVKCVFECVGKLPNTSQFSSIINLNENGYIITNSKLETNVKGIFACGDVVEKDVRQIATAINDGAIAAISANNYLK